MSEWFTMMAVMMALAVAGSFGGEPLAAKTCSVQHQPFFWTTC